MTKKKTAAIVLAAGLGTRMNSDVPKALHPLAGRPMVLMVLDTLAEAGIEQAVVVLGPETESRADEIRAHPLSPDIAYQYDRLGTGHAVLSARDALEGFSGDIFILFAGDPLITAGTCGAVMAKRAGDGGPAVVVVGKRPADPGNNGRLILGRDGLLERIVEARDATPDELAVELCNAGIMAVDGARLFGFLSRVGNDNAKGEYYLTDIVGMARSEGLACAVVEADDEEVMGIDCRADLARAEALVQNRLRARAMEGGATLADPATVYFSWDTKLGRDVTVGPNVVFGPGVAVGDGVEIKAFCHIEGASVGGGSRVGPFARLRPGAEIAESAHIGNFVEIKNASVEVGAKVNHLTYIGDARVGAGANIGAGTITCNYDGFFKDFTDIGARAFIGSNTALVAPVTVGDGAIIGAGSVITKDVAADTLALTRAEHRHHEGWAKAFRTRRRAEKEARQGKKKG